MSKKIKVGMMVRIIDSAESGKEYVGHIGKVSGKFDHPLVSRDYFEIDGAEPEKYAFRSDCLEPIDPESDDIKATREQGAPSFSKMMEKLKTKEKTNA